MCIGVGLVLERGEKCDLRPSSLIFLDARPAKQHDGVALQRSKRSIMSLGALDVHPSHVYICIYISNNT